MLKKGTALSIIVTNRSRTCSEEAKYSLKYFRRAEAGREFTFLFILKKKKYTNSRQGETHSYDKGTRVAIGFLFSPPTLF